jgi:hypothetical protein
MEFDTSVATGGGSDGGNTGNLTAVPSFFMCTSILTA